MHRFVRFVGILIFTVWAVQVQSSLVTFGQSASTSQAVTWSCTGSPCYWGPTDSGQALVWPASMEPISNRLGYTTSAPVYLPASTATGLTIAVTSGTATVYAGEPNGGSHRPLATLSNGDSYLVTGLGANEVISVQSGSSFDYTWSDLPPATPTATPTSTATNTPTETPTPTATNTPTATATNTPTETPTATATASPTPTSQNCTGPTDCAPVSDTAQSVTWTCTGTPCPWGASDSGYAIEWPAALSPTNSRLGYTSAAAVYLPANAATDMTIAITSGSATVYAGEPGASSHRPLAALGAGDSYVVTGLAAGEVLSVQSGSSFAYSWSIPVPPTPTPTFTPTLTPESCTGPDNCAPQLDASQAVIWTCTGSPCPWGATDSGNAITWPAPLSPTFDRLGYTASVPVYLAADVATNMTIAITSGSATVYAGEPGASSHRPLAALAAGDSYVVTGVTTGEVLSVQSGSPFGYTWSIPEPATPTPTPESCTGPSNCEPAAGASQAVTWNCTGTPCPWGATDSSNAIVWPAALGPTSNRMGYTASVLVYLPASVAEGMTIGITSGAANVYAGQPDAPSHRFLATLTAGDSYVVTGLASGEVLSVQGSSPFEYGWSIVAPTPTPESCTGPSNCAPAAGASQTVTWSCTGAPCPWGPSDSGNAIVWPAGLNPTYDRLGYTAAVPVYLPASVADGMTINITSGAATVYAGEPGASSHRSLAALAAGDSYVVAGLAAGEVLSVQSGSPFAYSWSIVAPPTPTPTPESCPGPDNCAPVSDTAQAITWTCTGTPCPWGATDSGYAVAWPATLGSTSSRLGYTASDAVYLPASVAADLTIEITSGTANVYAGEPGASSHRLLAALSAGDSYVPTGLAAGEVLSVQSGSSFGYAWSLPQVATPTPTPTFTPSATPTSCSGPSECGPVSDASQAITWTCSGSPCPWGATDSGNAIVWPAGMASTSNRLGYTASDAVYLSAGMAENLNIAVTSGAASVYAGEPNASSHRLLVVLTAGDSYIVTGLAQNEVISVQSSSPFAYTWSSSPIGTPTATPTPISTSQGGTPTATPNETATPVSTPLGCVDPATCAPVSSIEARWRCDTPSCGGPDWVAAVIGWPSWAAYPNNDRSGSQSRTVYSTTGEMLFPYMGPWADGCEVTAVSGRVLIIEWERGTDIWRETVLLPGDSHTISLTPPENGAMIETFDFDPPFSVLLNNCTPQPLPAEAAAITDGETVPSENGAVLQLYLPLISAGQAEAPTGSSNERATDSADQPVLQLYLPLISTK